MNIYKAGSEFKIVFFVGLVISVALLIFTVCSVLMGAYVIFIIPFCLCILISYLLLFVYAREISITQTDIVYKTVIRTKIMKYSDIKDIRIFYTSRSTIALDTEPDRQKAEMVCVIMLKDSPFDILLFGQTINNYKELYSRIVLAFERQRNSGNTSSDS